MATVKITGVREIQKQLRNFSKSLGRGVEKGLEKAGKHLLAKSLELVPTDDQDLYNSGDTATHDTGLNAAVHVFYSEEYAAEVHEDLVVAHGRDYNRKYADKIAAGAKYFYKGRFKTYHPRRPMEQAKFLEQPARQEADVLAGIVRSEIFKAIKK